MPWNRLFALRTERATRPVDREIDRPAVNTNVQKRPNRRAKHKGERAEEKILSRMLHAINRRFVSLRGVPSSMRSRCSFRIADTSASPWRSKSKYQALA